MGHEACTQSLPWHMPLRQVYTRLPRHMPLRQVYTRLPLGWRADRDGNILDNPPLAETIATDPLLADVRLVAWPGDARLLPRAGVRGFPHWGRWLERNLRCTADLARALGPPVPPPGLPADPDAVSTASALATRCPHLTSPPPLHLAGCCIRLGQHAA